MSNVHKIAVSGFGEGTNDIYDAVRPSYPAAALQKVHSVLSSSPESPKEGWTIVEPGSGTGIFSRLLLSPPAPTPAHPGPDVQPEAYPNFPLNALVGVEPSEGMRNAWYRGLDRIPRDVKGRVKVVEAVEGGFDDFSKVGKYGVEQGQVDGVIIAQAWHWCPDHEKALRNIASYLRPGSALILVWNLESFSPQWQADIRSTYQPYDLGTPQYYKGWWRECFDTQAYKELFEEKEEWKTQWSVGMSEDELINRLFSKSYLTPNHLVGEKREKLESDLRGVIRGTEHEWISKEKGIFKYHYDTDVVVLRRKA